MQVPEKEEQAMSIIPIYYIIIDIDIKSKNGLHTRSQVGIINSNNIILHALIILVI